MKVSQCNMCLQWKRKYTLRVFSRFEARDRKTHLIEWLAKLNDVDILNYLKVVKDSRSDNKDWWNELTEQQRHGIQRGLQDIDEGRIVSHNDVKKKHGL